MRSLVYLSFRFFFFSLFAAIVPAVWGNKIGTRIKGFDGCTSIQKSNIEEAYSDFSDIANVAGVKSDINWNEGAALEYLGPPGLNEKQQRQIQAVLTNVATIYPGLFLNPFTHFIHVRCDDPKMHCDGCTVQGNIVAYSANRDPDDEYPMINFCQPFFSKRSLTNAIAYGTALQSPEKFNLSRYDNRAQTMYHEILHLDLAADSVDNNPNPRVDDLTISIDMGRNEDGNFDILESLAYGPLRCKVLARYIRKFPDDFDTGYYVQRNADNLALFALAKYVQQKIGVYPHDPVITYSISVMVHPGRFWMNGGRR